MLNKDVCARARVCALYSSVPVWVRYILYYIGSVCSWSAAKEIRISTRERAWYLFILFLYCYYYYMPVHYDRVFFFLRYFIIIIIFCKPSPLIPNVFVPHLTFIRQMSADRTSPRPQQDPIRLSRDFDALVMRTQKSLL